MSYNDYNDTFPDMENQSSSSEDIVTFVGKLERIVYPKSPAILGTEGNTWGITGWTVESTIEGSVETNKYGNVSVKGNFYSVLDDKIPYKIMAKRIVDPNYGTQYEVIYLMENQDMSILSNQKAFLKTILTDRQIEELYKVYDNPLEIIANQDVEALKKAKGIGDYLADKIIEKYNDKKDWSTVYVEMDHFGLSPGIIEKLKKAYSTPARVLEKLRTNPYSLVYEVEGIGFLTADKIAVKSGLNPKGVKRIKEYIRYYLYEQGSEGNSYVTSSELTTAIYNFFEGKENILVVRTDNEGNVVGNNIGDAINQLVKDGVIGIEDNVNRSRRRVYSMKYYNLEKNIAKELHRIMKGPNYFNYSDWKEKIKRLEKEQGFEFTDEQLAGIKLGLDSKVCIITGSAGSGKSSLVAGILRSLNNYTFAQCALSGQAAARLQEVTGEDGMTIHRLLGYNPSNAHDEYNGFACNEDCPLEYDIIILDEISMVGGEIFYSLLKAIPDNAKLIMLGDTGQLESVGSLNLAHDMMESGAIPTVKLTKVHRQAQKSGILTSSYDVRNNIQLFPNAFEGTDVRGELQDMFFDVAQRRDDFLEKIIDYFEDIYNGELVNQNIMDIQVLTPVKERGATSVMELNRAIQGIVNPVDPSDETPKITVKHKKNDEDRTYYIHANDKVMCIKNNYKMSDVLGNPAPVYNGWTGIVKDMTEEQVFVQFPFYRHPVIFAMEDARKYLILGYASTVHKCVTGDSLIYTNKGIRKIQDISEEEIGDLKVWNGKYFEAPDKFVVNQPLNTLRVETKRRYSISGLSTHRMFVLGKDGYIVEKELKDLTTDDYLIINKNNNCFNQTNENISLPDEWFNLPPLYHNVKYYNLPTYLNEDFALFLGMMVADGCVNRKRITLGKKEKDYTNLFAKLVKKLFNYDVTPANTKGKMKINEVCSVHIASFCQKIDGLQPYHKDIPDIILSAPKNIQAKFLSALFEDGNINIKNGKFDHIELTSKDKNIIDKVRMMLLNFGIISSYMERDNFCKGKHYPVYCLYIYRKDAKIFAKEIGYITKLNQEKIKYCFKEPKMTYSNIYVPNVYKVVLKLIEDGKLREKSNQLKRIYQKIKTRKSVTSETLEKILLFYEQLNGENEDCKRLKDLLNNYYFDKVEKIEDAGLQSTYCFNMPETHSFIVNGLYSLNCQGSGFKAIIGVIDYSTPPSMLTCQLVYTLITRAKKLCVLVAQNGALRTAIANNFVSIKRTFLQEFLNAS